MGSRGGPAHMQHLVLRFLEMGNSRSTLQLQQEEIEEITAETGCTKQQIERLYARFSSLDKQSHGYLTREDFLRIPELAINPLAERIIDMFIIQSKSNQNNHATPDDRVNFKEFCCMLSNFKSTSKKTDDVETDSRTKKLRFLFKMYDQDDDGFVTTSEL